MYKTHYFIREVIFVSKVVTENLSESHSIRKQIDEIIALEKINKNESTTAIHLLRTARSPFPTLFQPWEQADSVQKMQASAALIPFLRR